MKDKKIKILLKAIGKVYLKNPGMQKLMEESMIDISKEEGVSPKQVFSSFSLLLALSYGLSKHKFFVCEG